MNSLGRLPLLIVLLLEKADEALTKHSLMMRFRDVLLIVITMPLILEWAEDDRLFLNRLAAVLGAGGAWTRCEEAQSFNA